MYGYGQNVAGAQDFGGPGFGGPGFGGPGVGGMHHGFAGPDYCYYDHGGGFGHGFRGGFALIVVLFILLIIIGATVVNYD
ncbi:YjcZ family sporulation protein [Virgibacillus sp. MSP4-1]|uniref:YjcZ family sporulation protein n=1 Tax=Virgibacillus sp. MSP4-1 TaxID=2700081 RepID=UPI00351B86B4